MLGHRSLPSRRRVDPVASGLSSMEGDGSCDGADALAPPNSQCTAAPRALVTGLSLICGGGGAWVVATGDDGVALIAPVCRRLSRSGVVIVEQRGVALLEVGIVHRVLRVKTENAASEAFPLKRNRRRCRHWRGCCRARRAAGPRCRSSCSTAAISGWATRVMPALLITLGSSFLKRLISAVCACCALVTSARPALSRRSRSGPAGELAISAAGVRDLLQRPDLRGDGLELGRPLASGVSAGQGLGGSVAAGLGPRRDRWGRSR